MLLYTDDVFAPIRLSSGRTIRHVRESNGSQRAIPTTGPVEMTEAEWREYRAALVAKVDPYV